MNLTADQILTLAPDDSSRKAGKDLSNPTKWVSKGISEIALWGECQGSGSKPYQTQVDLVNIAFKCSCPSRKFPCKHGLGLMLLYTKQPDTFGNGELPAWVADWIGKRAGKQEKQAEKKDKPADEAAQSKRQNARRQKVSDGTTELLLWLKDIVRNGIISMPEKDGLYFDKMARRMIDAQAPGLANMVSALGNVNFYAEGWESIFISQLARLYTLISGYHHIDELPEDLQKDILTLAGFPQSQDELKEQTGITDNWLVLGKEVSEENNLTVERCWLYATTQNRYALVLQFAARGQVMPTAITPGMYMQAELVYFPSATPLRAIIKQQQTGKTTTQHEAYDSWQAVQNETAHLFSRLPVSGDNSYIVEQLQPVPYNNEWWLRDKNGEMMQLARGFKQLWKLLAIGGGEAFNMAVAGKGDTYTPLGMWINNVYREL